MGAVIEIAPEIIQDVQDSQRQELEMLRKLNILQTFTIQGRDDEDCEKQFLALMDEPDMTLYVSEPGEDRSNNR